MRFLTRVFGIAICGVMLCTGCGQEALKSKVSTEQYEAIWGEIMGNMKKKKFMKKYTDELLKKHNLNTEDWEQANMAYGGMPAKFKAEYDRMMGVGSKSIPNGKSPPPPQAP